MTPHSPHGADAAIALKRDQIEAIFEDMGWEPEDAEVFLALALREMTDPGCLRRARAAEIADLLDRQSSGDTGEP